MSSGQQVVRSGHGEENEGSAGEGRGGSAATHARGAATVRRGRGGVWVDSSGETHPRPDPAEAAKDANRLSDGLPDAVQIAVSLERLHRAQDERDFLRNTKSDNELRAVRRQDQAMIKVLKDAHGPEVCDALGISWHG